MWFHADNPLWTGNTCVCSWYWATAVPLKFCDPRHHIRPFCVGQSIGHIYIPFVLMMQPLRQQVCTCICLHAFLAPMIIPLLFWDRRVNRDLIYIHICVCCTVYFTCSGRVFDIVHMEFTITSAQTVSLAPSVLLCFTTGIHHAIVSKSVGSLQKFEVVYKSPPLKKIPNSCLFRSWDVRSLHSVFEIPLCT